MQIRTFQPGDEVAQVSIYNEAAADLPRFKPANLDEVRRRCRATDFDPQTRFFALVDGQPIGYIGFQPNGRISYPWCRKGHESAAEPLFEHAWQALDMRGLVRVFTAYRGDWPAQLDFFRIHGFQQVREMLNFVIDLADMPTAAARRTLPVSPLRRTEVPSLLSLGSGVLRATSGPELERCLFDNPYFSADALFVLRNRNDESPEAVALLILNPTYGDPKQVDSAMPCFRLGAFGTEGMSTKRLNGLFSFLAHPADANRLGLDLLAHAAYRLRRTDIGAMAAQVPSDVPHLVRFYQSHFRRQASFPVLERTIPN
jgi:hypothetical protein